MTNGAMPRSRVRNAKLRLRMAGVVSVDAFRVRLTFYLVGKPAVILSLGKDSGHYELIFPEAPTKNSGESSHPKDGHPPEDDKVL